MPGLRLLVAALILAAALIPAGTRTPVVFGAAPAPTADEPPPDGTGGGLPVREIRLEGLKRTREYIVTRELSTRVGEPCLPDRLAEDRVRLDNLDIFSKIEISCLADGDSAVALGRRRGVHDHRQRPGQRHPVPRQPRSGFAPRDICQPRHPGQPYEPAAGSTRHGSERTSGSAPWSTG